MFTQTPTYGWQLPGAFEDAGLLDVTNAAWDEFEKIPEVANEFRGFVFLGNICLPASNVVMKSKEIHVPTEWFSEYVG